MKILIISFEENKESAEGLTRGFQSLGKEAQMVFPDADALLGAARIALHVPLKKVQALYWNVFKSRTNKKVLEEVRAAKPDAVISIGGEHLYAGTVEAMRQGGDIPVAAWVTGEPATLDPLDPYRWMNFSSYSHFFVVDELWGESLKPLLAPRVSLPFAGNDEVFRPVSVSKDIDVLFVGDLFPPHPHTASGYVRAKILHSLKQEQLVTKALVPGAEKLQYFFPGLACGISVHGVKSLIQVNQLLNRAKVVVYINTILLKTDFDAMLYNIAQSGSFVITDHKSNASHLFDGHLVTAKDPGQFVEKVRYYLAHPAEREDLARKVRQIALERHTYAQRAGVILEHITNDQ